MTGPISLALDDGVATVTIDRPESLNALNSAALDALLDALDEAEEREARVLVLTGAGETAFAAGADIEEMADFSTPEAHAYASLGHDVTRAIETFPAPAIAAINGYALGGGLELALACDLRVASERAVLGQTETDLGIVPGWGGTQRLPRLVGDETARRLVYFGDRVDAQDAHELGLVGDVVANDELDGHVAALASDLAARPRFALAAAKEAITQSHETDLAAGLDFERRTWASLFGTHDQREGMAAFLEERDPAFE
ncbi:enoyl-CoA hydratase/isomerase family protein [Halarchaeum sp. CBA1220]|uniref:enoyl-CoA hydratase/isomerase family protein n=1 Tax=Halarchaeum sp. CBA1220 TaxID=1853682 RepID=UPI000F3A960E|nr:enoyl-CoA hydratase-related protein [Halarchaeum sp. CBA1220]QLC33866.1 enoyl-CoA hydratase/isomerase family protein [Halarchaeum sp. CBA1220]